MHSLTTSPPPAASHQVGLFPLGIGQLCVRLPSILTHGIPAHLNAMGVVHQPVEDSVGQRGIAYLFVPPRDRQLRGQDRGAHLVTIFADLPEVSALWL